MVVRESLFFCSLVFLNHKALVLIFCFLTGGRIAIHCSGAKTFSGTLSSAGIFDSKFNVATMNVADQTIQNTRMYHIQSTGAHRRKL